MKLAKNILKLYFWVLLCVVVTVSAIIVFNPEKLREWIDEFNQTNLIKEKRGLIQDFTHYEETKRKNKNFE